MWGVIFGNLKSEITFSLLSLDLLPHSHLLQPISPSSGHQTGRHRSRSVLTDVLSISGVVSPAVAPPGSRHRAAELLQYHRKTGNFGGVSGKS